MIVAAVYIRSARDDGAGMRRQREACKDLANRLGLHVPPALVFTDRGAGLQSPSERPGYRGLLKAIGSEQVRCVLVEDVSRIGRSTLQVVKALRALEDTGVDLRTAR